MITLARHGIDNRYFKDGAYTKQRVRVKRGGENLLLITSDITNTSIHPHARGSLLKRVTTPIDSGHENMGGRKVFSSIETERQYHVNAPLAIAGTAAAAYGGYQAYQHRDQIKEKAMKYGGAVHNGFHSTLETLGVH